MNDLRFLMRNTVPIPGERGAVAESWRNILAGVGMSSLDIDAEIDATWRIWEHNLWPNLQ